MARLNHMPLKALLILTSVPLPCFAGGGVTPESILQNIIDYLAGDIARLTGVGVILGAGYLFLNGQRIQKATLIQTILGMGFILGAPTLASLWWN